MVQHIALGDVAAQSDVGSPLLPPPPLVVVIEGRHCWHRSLLGLDLDDGGWTCYCLLPLIIMSLC